VDGVNISGENNMKDSIAPEAFWISPSGEILDVPITHIRLVIDIPARFGMTSEEIENAYTDENEELGTEGIAREKIIINLIGKGWIRIRYYPRRTGWTVNVHSMDGHTQDILREWSGRVIASGRSGYDEVIIDTPVGRKSVVLADLTVD
jgi:hypothetical protein